ncbi:hypothetical protein [Anaerolactibacter massiliensis]|uniref:hypothetical protein n=1 Tax=Anaerolactibacter massiliensis TaxID=2044573 RepID=UPI000CF98D37|nr:hypothetical protein [Anaerolactibacter massiliensis]
MSDEKKKTTATVAKVPAKPELVLYVGPTIKGIAITGTVYASIPDAALKAKEEAPLIANLFISPAEYGKAHQQIKAEKGWAWEAYKQTEGLRKKEG